MANEKTIKDSKEKLKWLEETPFYIGNDGMPSVPLILFGILGTLGTGLIVVLTYKYFKKKSLRKYISINENLA